MDCKLTLVLRIFGQQKSKHKIMKKLLFTLLAIISASTFALAIQKVQTVNIKTRIACDHCKMCGSCSARIEKALYSQKGVKRVDVDDKKMEIVVVYNSEKINADKIKEAIAHNGYDADDIKATPESYAKLDGCCRGEE
jgi:mercuric ion binding protein